MDLYNNLIADYPWINTFLALAFLITLAVFANFIVKVVLLRSLNRIVSRLSLVHGDDIVQSGVLARLANTMPALVFSLGIALVPELPDAIVLVTRNVANAFIILTMALALSAILNALDTIYHKRADAIQHPIKSYLQIIKIIIFAIATILMIATIIDRSPLILLSGLGALTAVLILVFQDTLLSLVASIQVSSTDMVRVGDWIEMPQLNADGDVIDIALHTVRVQNWDKTITTLPIRKIVSEPFKNWRGMQLSGGRRIKRSLYIDQSSIRFLSDEECTRLSALMPLTAYINDKTTELDEWNKTLRNKGYAPENTRRLTNIGTFRAYIENYLKQHPLIHQDMTLMVRQLDPTPQGLPIEIYCFTSTTEWSAYEEIQADIFDHLYALLPEFGLHVFQNPTGHDIASLQSFLSHEDHDEKAKQGRKREKMSL